MAYRSTVHPVGLIRSDHYLDPYETFGTLPVQPVGAENRICKMGLSIPFVWTSLKPKAHQKQREHEYHVLPQGLLFLPCRGEDDWGIYLPT